MGPGPIALVGSGEFLPGMEAVDKELLAGRPARAVFLPTAAAEEGDDVVRYWTELGTAHYRRLGVEPVGLPVLTRDDAHRPDLAELVAGAGLIYLSGGNPGYVAETLRGTPVWAAIVTAWQAGAAIAGCSAGAGALTAVVHDVRRPGRPALAGLGLVPHMAVIPHFDRIEAWSAGIVERFVDQAPPGATVVGIDEDTALVGGASAWRVAGRQRAWVIDPGGRRTPFEPGEAMSIPQA